MQRKNKVLTQEYFPKDGVKFDPTTGKETFDGSGVTYAKAWVNCKDQPTSSDDPEKMTGLIYEARLTKQKMQALGLTRINFEPTKERKFTSAQERKRKVPDSVDATTITTSTSTSTPSSPRAKKAKVSAFNQEQPLNQFNESDNFILSKNVRTRLEVPSQNNTFSSQAQFSFWQNQNNSQQSNQNIPAASVDHPTTRQQDSDDLTRSNAKYDNITGQETFDGSGVPSEEINVEILSDDPVPIVFNTRKNAGQKVEPIVNSSQVQTESEIDFPWDTDTDTNLFSFFNGPQFSNNSGKKQTAEEQEETMEERRNPSLGGSYGILPD